MRERAGGRLGRRALDYLLAIYILSQGKGSARLTEISRYLGVTPPSAHEYVSELIEMGFVAKKGRGEYSLTGVGMEILLRRIHAHGVLEEMLVRVFKVDPEAACVIASAIDTEISGEELEKICTALGHPRRCPHGMRLPHGGEAAEIPQGGICIKVERG